MHRWNRIAAVALLATAWLAAPAFAQNDDEMIVVTAMKRQEIAPSTSLAVTGLWVYVSECSRMLWVLLA
jgi:hypothetical protein